MSDEFEDIPKRLKDDLAAMYESPVVIPARLTNAILNDARVQLAKRSRWRAARWVGAAAAAACVVLVARFALQSPLSPDDIDGNRRVDVVDALVLARQIEAGRGRDVTSDGVADQSDVDAIALVAVRLDPGGVQ